MSITFKICEKNNVDSLIAFIDKHWKKDHIFVKNRKLFDWQHKNGETYNFVLAMDEGQILGILGFIPTSQFSKGLLAQNEIWLAIWKVRRDVQKPGLGLLLLDFINKRFNNPTICSIGLSKQVIPLYKALNYKVGLLEHRAFFNQHKATLRSAYPPKAFSVKSTKNNIEFNIQIKEFDLAKCTKLFHSKPEKDSEYIFRRYIKHPVYEYKLLFFKNSDDILSIAVYRIVNINDLIVARIVDIIGSNILKDEFNYPLTQFLKKENIDYIDLVSNIECSKNSGFIESDATLILPNYLEPLEMRNVDIDYAYKSNSGSLSIFRGDSDQDRPNV